MIQREKLLIRLKIMKFLKKLQMKLFLVGFTSVKGNTKADYEKDRKNGCCFKD